MRPLHRSPRPAAPRTATPWRALAAGAAALAAAALLGGCVTRSPLPQLHRLPTQPPVAISSAPAASATAPAAWQLMAPVQVPAYLDDDRLLLPQGATGLQPLPSERWAEPLRDAVARVLLADLSLLRGAAPVWATPLPAGAAPARQLRVELLALEAAADRGSVVLQARWSLADASGATPPQMHGVRLEAPATGPEPAALAAAHRLVLWRLAERIAATP